MSEQEAQRWQRVADALTARLKQMVWSQKELADRSGVGEDTISKIVNVRQFGYRATTLRRIATAVGWTPDALFRIADGEDPADIPNLDPHGFNRQPEAAAGYDVRIAKLDPEDVRYVEAIIEAAERRKGLR